MERRAVAFSSPVSVVMLLFRASNWRKPPSSASVMASPAALLRADSRAVRRFASGMVTVCASAKNNGAATVAKPVIKHKINSFLRKP